MKHRVITFALLFLTSLSVHATIRTVSNSPAFPGQFATVDAAIAASSPGDTIYIMPSSVGYPMATLNKQLVLIGSGINPQRPSHLNTVMPNINMTISAAGSSIMGIHFWAGNNWYEINSSSPVNNLYASECVFTDQGGGALILWSSNAIIENCIISGSLHTGGSNVNNIFQNNIISSGITLHPASNAIIRNNIFASSDANIQAFPQGGGGEFMGSSVQILNNIFYKNNPAGGVGQVNNCTFINNIYYLTNNPTPVNATSSGNLNTNPLFVNFPAPGANFSFQYDYHLQAASPGINYGTDGKDVGMWGGMVPVNAGFEPPIPRIYDLQATNASVPVGGTLQLTIKATKAQ